jgi:hypothetical protein
MNYKRLALAAIAASITLLLGEMAFITLMGGRLMAARQAAGLPEITPQPLVSIIELLLTGAFIVWLYAAIRTRYGAGPMTAIGAGFASWTGIVLLSTIHTIGENMGFPATLLLMVAGVILPVFILTAVVGAWVYRE